MLQFSKYQFLKTCIVRKLHCSNVKYQIPAINMAYDVIDTAQTNKLLPPVVIMHGLLGSKQNWRSVSKVLESKTKRKIYSVDARNHGDSPHASEHDEACMAADVKDFININNMEKVCLMGHSMGGRAMMYFSLRYPQFVDRAIFVDISPISIPRDESSITNILQSLRNMTSLNKAFSLAEGRKVLKDQLLKELSAEEPYINFIMLNLRKHSVTGEFFWAPNIHGLEKYFSNVNQFEQNINKLPPFPGRTLFVCGKRSNFVNPKDWPQILKYYPNAEILWLDTGHLVHLEKPREFLDIIIHFLS